MRKGMFGRMPLWGKVVPIIALAAGIAAAVAGSGIMGDNLVKVQDPIIVDSVTAGGATGVTFNDDLSFEVTAETYPGETYDLTIGVTNLTGVAQTHRLSLVYPDGFRFSRVQVDQGAGMVLTDGFRFSRVQVDQGAGMVLTQEDPSNFVFTVDADTTASMEIDVEVLPQVLPGWYTINGETEALETDLSNVG